ncbi:hypothetical protein [Vibrio phage VP-HS15]|uniref:N-acetyltransferase domain-containing protein n=1 Tax=Vibrio phage VP-HS15 TaxID=2686284 RepID=A0A6B9LHB9_9CAUD|nr:hypothetical protein [Vibrio phage VP-HS15]
MIKVRQATLLDLLAFAPLAHQYAEEAAKHNNFPVDIEHTMQNAAITVQNEDGCLLLAYDDNEPVGLLWGWCHALPWSKARLAFDTILYVVPEKRKTSVGYKLMKAWEAWADARGAVEVQISIASGIHEEETEGFFKKLGYSYVGCQFRKQVRSK